MAQAIDEKYRAGDFFVHLMDLGWKPLNSYTHTGLLQLGRRFTGPKLESAYGDAEIVQITTTATTCVLLLISRFFAVQKHPGDVKEAEKLIEAYGQTQPMAQRGPRAGGAGGAGGENQS